MSAYGATSLELPSQSEVAAADNAIRPQALVTPIVAVPAESVELDVKLESLQPSGSFKIRGATAAYSARAHTSLGPLATVSAGNMGRAVAHVAAASGRSCSVYVPDHAPEAKLGPMRELGARIERMPFGDWWDMVVSARSPLADAVFVHPFLDRDVIAGNATIATEIATNGTEYDAVLVPWGGGGLALGIAHALRPLAPRTDVYAVEVTTASPLAAAWEAGEPVTVDYQATFVDGIGSTHVLPQLWDHARDLLAGVVAVTPEDAADAVRLLASDLHVVVEGAAACAVAAARDPRFRERRVLAIASGGNLDAAKLATILQGGMP